MVGRISTVALHNTTLRYANSTSLDLAKQTQQISSGIKASSFSELAGNVERISGFEEKIGKIDVYISSNSLISTRLNSITTALNDIQQVAESFRSDLTLYNQTTSENFSIQASAESALQQIEDLLSISIGGRYLFSGSRTNIPPISDITAPVNTYGEADANYYQGDSEKSSGKISDSFELEYGVTANDPALQSLITGIRTVLEGAINGSDNVITSGQDLVSDSITTLSTLRAKVNLDITTVDSVNSQHTQLQLFWQQSLSEELDADAVSLQIELDINKTILQASFQAFASLSQLKLTDYL